MDVFLSTNAYIQLFLLHAVDLGSRTEITIRAYFTVLSLEHKQKGRMECPGTRNKNLSSCPMEHISLPSYDTDNDDVDTDNDDIIIYVNSVLYF